MVYKWISRKQRLARSKEIFRRSKFQLEENYTKMCPFV